MNVPQYREPEAPSRRSDFRRRRLSRTACKGCGQRAAKSRPWSAWTQVRWHRGNTLCLQCYRAALDQLRARQMAECGR